MISYCISTYQEKDEITQLLYLLKAHKTDNEEIIVLQTYQKDVERVSGLYTEIQDIIKSMSVDKYAEFHFQNNFAEIKNYMNSLASQKYIFNLDADELIEPKTLLTYREILKEAQDIDLYYLPRINIVEGLTPEDVKKWSWKTNEFGWVNWPDYQPRIYRNLPSIKWAGRVHEHITGHKQNAIIKASPDLAIIHKKNIVKQREQNTFYETLT
jgi:glycosyltransferase involved in cell wall biosynthesis